MEIDLFRKEGFIALNLIPGCSKGARFCRNVFNYFRKGDLHVSIVDSRLNIRYDGKESSFEIGKDQRKAFKEGLTGVWQGTHSVSVIPLEDGGCGFRFIKSKLANGVKNDPFQTRLVESYLPPPELWTEDRKKAKKLSFQRRLSDAPYFVSSRPLFRKVEIKTEQRVLVE